MAFRSAAIVHLLAIILPLAFGLQVTPNSPCASFCIDSSDLDKSDPNSSNTKGRDITCQDDDFGSSVEGQKFQRCLSCLQDSTFQQGSESDQDWFLYNLRYSFDYCVFGFPNATDVGNSPCVTSEACGGIENALKEGILSPQDRDMFDYCDVDGESMLGDSYEKCLTCVQADQGHHYVSNFLVALEAGCRQQSPPNITVGLNDTVFAKTEIEIIDPTASSDSDSGSGISLPTTAIVGISIGGLVVLLLAAGCVFLQCRKRKNIATRSRRVRASSLSFQCQTHLTPRTPGFGFGTADGYADETQEKSYPYMSPSQALGSNPVPAGLSLDTNFTATKVPSPPAIHSSPKLVSPDDFITPTSTTSTRSNAPLLQHRPYNPAEHTIVPPPLASPPLFSPGFGISSPRPSSPVVRHQQSPSRKNARDVSPWEEEHLAGTTRSLGRKKSSWGVTSPVEVRNIQTSFPPPPKRGL